MATMPMPTLIRGRPRDLGDGFTVRRMLPHLQAPHVGPFVFFDHMGPACFQRGQGLDVRPHPHIGLATVTWLFDGVIRHRDSLGSVQDIHPGDVNWMTAGRGIVHSERSPPSAREGGGALNGIQTWVALPKADEETEPSFEHPRAATLPAIERPGVRMRLIAGSAYGQRSPVTVFSPMFYLEARLDAGARLTLPAEHVERGLYLVEGSAQVGDLPVAALEMAVQTGGGPPDLVAIEPCHVILFGGTPPDGGRTLWWNFVSSSKERIERAREDWCEGRMPGVPGDHEFIPLPAS